MCLESWQVYFYISIWCCEIQIGVKDKPSEIRQT